jgi:hypothetical protein
MLTHTLEGNQSPLAQPRLGPKDSFPKSRLMPNDFDPSVPSVYEAENVATDTVDVADTVKKPFAFGNEEVGTTVGDSYVLS